VGPQTQAELNVSSETAADVSPSDLDQRLGQARAGAIEKESHAQGLCTLHRNQAHLPANVIAVVDPRHKGLVGFGITLEPGDAVFNRLAKARADLITFMGGEVADHGNLLWSESVGSKFFKKVLK
jgi:hypothetical protein